MPMLKPSMTSSEIEAKMVEIFDKYPDGVWPPEVNLELLKLEEMLPIAASDERVKRIAASLSSR
jgi:hypothetical protein